MGSAHALDVGDTVPDLALALSSDRSARLADYAGQWLVVYFYPKDAPAAPPRASSSTRCWISSNGAGPWCWAFRAIR